MVQADMIIEKCHEGGAMSAEFFITFSDPDWRQSREPEVADRLEGLRTFVKRAGNEFWLRGKEAGGAGRFPYDVRVFMQPDRRLLLEISAHPKSIDEDLHSFLAWLRSNTSIQVVHEDGEPSGW